MNGHVPHITICLCTFRRPALLSRLLTDLGNQETEGRFTFSVVVSDNDPGESARPVVADFVTKSRVGVTYVTEARRSISHARNKSLEPARGDFIAFIDDDEFPSPGWLLTLFRTCLDRNVSGVLGPVRTFYDEHTPDWVRRGGFYDRPEHETGFVMQWNECRTGNVLLDLRALVGINPVFRAEFGGGASDQDLFRRLMEAGHRFIWCNEAVVFEVLPPGRCKRTFLIRRALLRGSISIRHPTGRLRKVAMSLVAVPLYTAALPFLQLSGHHLFMKYLVKLCDHSGRLLAVIGLHPIRVRDME